MIRKLSYLAIFILIALNLSCNSSDMPSWTNRYETLTELRAYREDLSLYDGAPLVIPHGVASLGREYCLNCHAPGNRDNGERIALPYPHEDWSNCLQCHVERRSSDLFQASIFTPLRRRSRDSVNPGITPAVNPHHLQNRENCAICHMGAQSPPALRAKHEYRPACTQCHISSSNQ